MKKTAYEDLTMKVEEHTAKRDKYLREECARIESAYDNGELSNESAMEAFQLIKAGIAAEINRLIFAKSEFETKAIKRIFADKKI